MENNTLEALCSVFNVPYTLPTQAEYEEKIKTETENFIADIRARLYNIE